MLKKLPIGIQTFKDIRDKKEDYLYVDKTDIAYDLINSGRYYFLSRPRRFGKSLFMDTLQNIFEGEKHFFKDLDIYDKWDWNITYPVIKIAFGGVRSSKELLRVLFSILGNNQKRLDVVCKDIEDYAICFQELIEQVYEKYNQKVVILIDEYDKPILDNLDQMDVAKENKEILKRFYTEIKNADQYIKFAMLTGVSKFSKVSVFSGLNMLKDISLDKRYGNICGYTQNDIETTFLPYLKDVDLDRVKGWYNGYNFLKDKMYNPFDILLFIDNDFKFSNYWFSTATPTFLIKLMEQNNYFLPNLSNLVVGEELLDSFNIDNLNIEVILYQTGYLTIDEVVITPFDSIEYRLKLPNIEVKQSLNNHIIEYLTKNNIPNTYKTPIYNALQNANLNDLETSLKLMFSSIPYNNYTKNILPKYEGYYASVIYVYLQSLGLDIIGEDVTNKGRIDLTVKITKLIYIIEFKVGKEDALKQIKEKRYYEKYLDLNQDIYLVGINFDQDKRNISKFEYEKIIKQ